MVTMPSCDELYKYLLKYCSEEPCVRAGTPLKQCVEDRNVSEKCANVVLRYHRCRMQLVRTCIWYMWGVVG